MTPSALRRVLVALVSGAEDTAAAPAGLRATDWMELDRMAGEHRLRPLLHHRLGSDPAVPDTVSTTWQTAFRQGAMIALIQQAELAETVRLLADEGIAAVALKGAWLSRHAYPHPALRPMRDIDLLVPRDQVLAAFSLLERAGYTQPLTAELSLADSLRLDKHLPPLQGPRGTLVELHHLLWEPDGRLDHASPRIDEAAVIARARHDQQGVLHPAPSDLLAHLIVHAVYSHRLDCGPLILPDIAYLLNGCEPLDWPTFWAQTQRDGWRDGARLLLELAAPTSAAAQAALDCDTGQPVPPALLEAAPDLLLHRLDRRSSARVAAATLKDGRARLWQLARGRKRAGSTEAVRDMSGEGGRLGWALSRGWRTLRDLSRTEVRDQARQLAALSRWLDR